MTDGTTTPTAGTGSISVDGILTGAFEVAAEVSIDNLSMPLPARHLDVGVTSIYWYFRKKDELLDAMTDRALAQYEFTVPGIDASNWRESLRNHVRTMRRQFLDDPVLRPCPHSRAFTHCTVPCTRSNDLSRRWSKGLTPEQAVRDN